MAERFWRLLVIARVAVARAKDPRNPDLATADQAVQRLLGLPRLPLGRTIVAQYYLRVGQLDLALAEAEQAAFGKSDCRRCFQVLARVYAARGNFRAALAAAERVAGLLPYGSELLEWNAWMNDWRRRIKREQDHPIVEVQSDSADPAAAAAAAAAKIEAAPQTNKGDKQPAAP